jgi:hypothetical protein
MAVERQVSLGDACAGLDLHEGDGAAAADDEVDFSYGRAQAAG